MKLGFSTGSLAKGDFRKALQMLKPFNSLAAIELSALRESELPLLVEALPSLELSQYKYISLHAPSKLVYQSETQIIECLKQVVSLKIHVIVHPDIITNFNIWRTLGRFLCIENMDKRKPVGRTTQDLTRIFKLLPEAMFCLDLAHAKQVDPSMVECSNMLVRFKSRLLQFHISDVTSDSNHTRINEEAAETFRKVQTLIPENIPFIIESPLPESYIARELNYISGLFSPQASYRMHATDNPQSFLPNR